MDKNKVSTFALAFGKGASGRGRQANVKRKILKKIDKNFVSSKIGCNFAELSAQEKWASEKSRKANEHWKIYNRDEVVQEQLKL